MQPGVKTAILTVSASHRPGNSTVTLLLSDRLRRSVRRLVLPVALAAAAATLMPHTALPQRAFQPQPTFEGPPGFTLQPFPRSAAGSYLAGLIAQFNGDAGAAADYFGQTALEDPANPLLAELALGYSIEAGEIDAALRWAESTLRVTPSHEAARLALAAAAFRDGDFSAAGAQLDAIVPVDDLTTLTVGLLRAWSAQGQGDTDDALTMLAALDGEPWFAAYTAYHSALIADRAGRSAEAVGSIAESAAALSTLRTLEVEARIRARADDGTDAATALRDYLGIVPYNEPIERLLEEIESGASIASPVADAVAGAAEVFYSLATAVSSGIFSGDGLDSIALSYLQLARFIGPASPLTTLAAGQLLQRMGRHEMAVAVLDEVPADSSFLATMQVQAALSLEVLERTDEAAAYLEPIVAADPRNLPATLALASVYSGTDNYPAMLTVLDDGIAALAEPTADHWRLFYLRGIASQETGDWQAAEADFLRALELSPDQPDVLNYLGYTWIDRRVNLTEALDLIERAVSQRPDSGYIIDSLGWAYYRLGNFEEAATALERAVALEPSHPVLLDHLGDAYWRVGRRREAVFAWNHALDFDPAPELQAAIEEKLLSGLPEESNERG